MPHGLEDVIALHNLERAPHSALPLFTNPSAHHEGAAPPRTLPLVDAFLSQPLSGLPQPSLSLRLVPALRIVLTIPLYREHLCPCCASKSGAEFTVTVAPTPKQGPLPAGNVVPPPPLLTTAPLGRATFRAPSVGDKLAWVAWLQTAAAAYGGNAAL